MVILDWQPLGAGNESRFDGYRLITQPNGAWHLWSPNLQLVATGHSPSPRMAAENALAHHLFKEAS